MAGRHILGALSVVAMVAAVPAFADEEASAPYRTDRITSVQGQKTSLGQRDPQPVQRPSQGGGPRTHTVESGDTLWDLSAEYMSDPYKWPALWSYNPQVTNPHWIYPGDTIYLEPYAPHLVTEVVAPADPAPSPVVKPIVGSSVIRVPGFYISELPESRGHVLFSDQEKHLLSEGDEVQVDWVDIEMRKKVSNGQRFTIFEESDPVRDEDGEPLAYKLVRLGTLEIIDHRNDTLSTARIIDATREIERGSMIIPNEDLTYTIRSTTNAKSMEGRVIDTIDLISLIAAEQYVIINRGAEDGVANGNRWVVFEQREGLDRLPQGEQTHTQYAEEKDKKDKDDEDRDPRDGDIQRDGEHSWVLGHPPYTPEFPKRDSLDDIYGDREYTTDDLPLRKIGEILVVDTKDKFCTGIVVGASRELTVDTRVVMIKGY